MIAYWGDEEHDIKVPFVLGLAAAVAAVYLMDGLGIEYGGEYEEEQEESWLYGGRFDVAMHGCELLPGWRASRPWLKG
jgi:hypothetical protein